MLSCNRDVTCLSVLQAWIMETRRIYDVWLSNLQPSEVFCLIKVLLAVKEQTHWLCYRCNPVVIIPKMAAELTFKYQHIQFFLLFCWYERCQIWYWKWLIILLQTLLLARSLVLCVALGTILPWENKLRKLKNCQRCFAEHFPEVFRQHFQSKGSKLCKLALGR